MIKGVYRHIYLSIILFLVISIGFLLTTILTENNFLTPQKVLAADTTVTPGIYLPVSLQDFINRYMPNHSGVLGVSTSNNQSSLSQQLNQAGDDDDLTLNDVFINKVIVVDPPFRSPMYYGLLINTEGRTEEIIDNFDCEFNVLANDGVLKMTDATSLPLKTRTYQTDVTFQSMTVKKITDINTKVAMFSSRSFVYDGEAFSCEKISTGQRFSGWVKTTSRRVGNYIIQVVDRINK